MVHSDNFGIVTRQRILDDVIYGVDRTRPVKHTPEEERANAIRCANEDLESARDRYELGTRKLVAAHRLAPDAWGRKEAFKEAEEMIERAIQAIGVAEEKLRALGE